MADADLDRLLARLLRVMNPAAGPGGRRLRPGHGNGPVHEPDRRARLGAYCRGRVGVPRGFHLRGPRPDRTARGAGHRAGPARRPAGPGEEHREQAGRRPGAQGLAPARPGRGEPALRAPLPHPRGAGDRRPGVAGMAVTSGADPGGPVGRGAHRAWPPGCVAWSAAWPPRACSRTPPRGRPPGPPGPDARRTRDAPVHRNTVRPVVEAEPGAGQEPPDSGALFPDGGADHSVAPGHAP